MLKPWGENMLIKLIEPLLVDDIVIDKFKNKLESMGHTFIQYKGKPIDIAELSKRIEGADIAIIGNFTIPRDVILNAENLKFISVAFTGVDHIDLESAKKRNIKISNAVGYSDTAVSELVIGLAINLYRKIQLADGATRHHGTSKGIIGSVLKGKTVGIIGCGRIGKETGQLFNAFGCQVIGYSPRQKEEDLEQAAIKKVDLDTLLSKSDIISLHIPANEDNINFIDKYKLSKMKKSAILINTARGAVVDNNALADALNSGEINGAGIDVFDMEPPIPKEYKLLNAKNTLFTPHIAYATKESMILRANIAFDNVLSYLNGKLENEIL